MFAATHTNLEGVAAERFRALAIQIKRFQEMKVEPRRLDALCQDEISWISGRSTNVTPELLGTWCNRLKRMFKQEGDPIMTTLTGQIIRVALGENTAPADETLAGTEPLITMHTLGEIDVQHLLEGPFNNANTPLTIEKRHLSPTPSRLTIDFQPPTTNSVDTPSTAARVATRTALGPNITITHPCAAASAETSTDWPPEHIERGMIGQDETVRQLINRIHYARDFSQPFKETMCVGSAGAGKSSFAHTIVSQLHGQTPIMFSGADLRSGRMIFEILQQEEKAPDSLSSPVRLESCILLIDEVHALPHLVSYLLLSALDYDRLTTIDNTDYDFGQVVFLKTAIDAGKLTEAFRSRPDRVLLRNYTLDELAGILWLHGQGAFDGYPLTREVCFEFAARTRAQPRVAVRMLTNQLIPHFYAQIRDTSARRNRYRICNAMTAARVADYFERQGIDINGLDSTTKNFLGYLARHGAMAVERLRQGHGISNRGDFVETDEYLQRLGLVIVRGERSLTPEDRRYMTALSDLRHRISRQR
jgi:Holliday junction resolvasome RuvABC ATP-dependent DNA helicase subunit